MLDNGFFFKIATSYYYLSAKQKNDIPTPMLFGDKYYLKRPKNVLTEVLSIEKSAFTRRESSSPLSLFYSTSLVISPIDIVHSLGRMCNQKTPTPLFLDSKRTRFNQAWLFSESGRICWPNLSFLLIFCWKMLWRKWWVAWSGWPFN